MTEEQKRFVEQVEQALHDLGAKGVLRILEPARPYWTFSVFDHGQFWPLKLCPIGWNFHNLPAIFWCTALPLWGWPHTSSDGDICVSDREGLEYDPNDIVGVLRWLLAEATRMLASNRHLQDEERRALFADELEGYLNNCGAWSVQLDSPLDSATPLYAEVEMRKQGAFKVTPIVRRINSGITELPHCQQQCIGFIDVTIHQLLDLRRSVDVVWWEGFLSRLSPGQREIAISPKNRGVLLRVPNKYGHALVLLYWGVPAQAKRWSATSYLLKRQDRDYLMQRTGGAVVAKHVMVVGCGSIGSRVAEHLALGGVSKLTLVDNDRFTADNLGRHILGKESISQYKVEALATLLRQRSPGIDVLAKATAVQPLLANGALSQVDVVVLTTGNSVLERAIVRMAFQERWRCLIVCSSVEAAGLGGHAIAMRPGVRGCLDCLYIDPDTQQPVSGMTTALVAAGQNVTRQLTGCGAFTPYSAIDATRTAILAVERVLAESTAYSRWSGEGLLAKAEHITPSATYFALRAGRIPSELGPDDFAQPRCKCCSA
ncbi:ThiF family protein [Pseudomonas sp. WPR_5_2]|uniref:ThiF family adenylyltransferase n=1 Tax=Pseudomonas sp. WPR_5_2 TaxID=1907371 RepID=UPI000EB3B63D|nr:ThiF family adenylyltransferase [Pseudomonas sp. WPR_5_2]RKS24522.1 ThiF family protein [Pseudomonas sp. WPR_5_2]